MPFLKKSKYRLYAFFCADYSVFFCSIAASINPLIENEGHFYFLFVPVLVCKICGVHKGTSIYYVTLNSIFLNSVVGSLGSGGIHNVLLYDNSNFFVWVVTLGCIPYSPGALRNLLNPYLLKRYVIWGRRIMKVENLK